MVSKWFAKYRIVLRTPRQPRNGTTPQFCIEKRTCIPFLQLWYNMSHSGTVLDGEHFSHGCDYDFYPSIEAAEEAIDSWLRRDNPQRIHIVKRYK